MGSMWCQHLRVKENDFSFHNISDTKWMGEGGSPINNVDTNLLELAQTPQVKGSVPQECPHFEHQSQVVSTQVIHILSDLTTAPS